MCVLYPFSRYFIGDYVKIFSAGQNIRGNVKVENFVYNMAPDGYEKMVKLADEYV